MNIEIIEETFSCSDNPQLNLSNIRGSVTIQASEGGMISVKAHKHLNTGDGENTLVELGQTDDGTVVVRTRYDYKGFRFFQKWVPCKVDYEIRVPEKCSLKVRGVSSSASIAGINGTQDISSVSGDVNLQDLAGELRIKVVSGDVFGEKLSGISKLETVSGDITINKSNISKISGKTVSGDLIIESLMGDGPHDFNSVSGDIRLYLPRGRGVTISSSSLSGSIRNSLTSSQSSHTRNKHRIQIEGGGIEINHNSVSGDIFLIGENNHATSPTEEDQLLVEEPTQSVSAILEQINRGELSVDQAVEMLASESG